MNPYPQIAWWNPFMQYSWGPGASTFSYNTTPVYKEILIFTVL